MADRAPPFRSGQRLRDLRQPLNQLVDAVNAALPGVGSRQADRLPPSAIEIRQFKIVSVDGDYLNCQAWNGLANGPTLKIAKPYLLRRTPFDSSTHDGISYSYSSDIQRTGTSGGDSETQVVTPSYVAGDIIYAINGITGGAAVTDSGTPIRWLDMNIDGRAWAKKAGT